jgi:hypothetical protein
MFSVSFFSLRQSLRPFFIFLNSYILGAYEASNSKVLSGMFRTNFPPIWDTSHADLGHISREFRTNSCSRLGTSHKKCPNLLWITLKLLISYAFLTKIQSLGQIHRHGYG